MVKYEMEIVNSKGNKFRDGEKTLTATRVKACRYAKKEDCRVNIFEKDGYAMKLKEFIFYDPDPSGYNDFRPGFYLQQTGKEKSRRYRVSPTTGKLLDVSKTWKYL